MNHARSLRHCLLALSLAAVLLGSFAAITARADSGPLPAPRHPHIPASSPAPTPEFPLPLRAQVRPAALDAPDLSVQTISRGPHYRRYCLSYANDVPELCAGTENEQRFPEPGQPVTFTARVQNQGDITSTLAAYTWRVDGGVSKTGWVPALGPGEGIDLQVGWSWLGGEHHLNLSVEAAASDLITTNNWLDHRTDAHYLEVLVHPYFVAAFKERQNLLGSYSFHDWIQAQFAQTNERLAAAGVSDRIRIDVITSTVAVGGDTVVGEFDFDGRWSFRSAKDLKRTPEDEAWLSAQNYAALFAGGIDWGLIHELAHQLGVIDLYQLNVSPGAGNEVLDGDALPLLSGFYWRQPGLMGGDVSTAGGLYFSEHTAMALTANSGFRRGYFGEYLYDLPAAIWLHVRDNAGADVVGAVVEAFQTERGVISAGPVSSGKTGAGGLFLLPDRPLSPTLTTATGHQFRANPFGHIDVVGGNGQLLLRLRKNGQETYRWLPITELNKAAWRGQNSVVLTLDSHFPPDPSLAPPALTVRTAGWDAELSWPPVAGAAGYRLYRASWPRYDEYTLIAEAITATNFTAVLTETARFALSAVDAAGNESGFSNIARAELLHAPAALVWEPNSAYGERGQLTVIDGHSGALLRLLPPENDTPARWLGRMGSEHHGQTGAVAATRKADGTLGVALSGSRIWQFTPKLELVNWFGKIGEFPSVLTQPAGLALTGPPFDYAQPLLRPDPSTILLLPFDGTLSDPNGAAPDHWQGLTFGPGRFGQALEIGTGAGLQYPGRDWPSSRGGVEFWIQPHWSSADKQPHVLLEVGDPARDPDSDEPGFLFQLAHSGHNVYAWVTDFVDYDKAAWGDIGGWQAGEWHHIAVTWEAQRLNLHIDGLLAWAEALPEPISGTAPAIAIGGTLAGEYAADAAIDNFRISDFPRLGNSDLTRLLVPEAGTPAIKVLDMLGNHISTADLSALPGLAPGHIVAGPHGDFWLADIGAHRLHRLRFDGDSLSYADTLPVEFESGPTAPVFSESGLLAVADADRVLVLDPARANPTMRVWSAPNDGSAGSFSAPAALAFGPNGDPSTSSGQALAVAERGNRRVSFIIEPDRTPLWLPLIQK